MINVGAATIDITPPAGLAMAGFAARTGAATGTHAPLTARALVVEDTALVTLDVIGIDAELSKRARARCALPEGAVTIAATHTHGGPVSMPGRLSAKANSAYLIHLEASIVQAIDAAMSRRKPVRVFAGVGAEPGFAKNRRRSGGPVDKGVPILWFENRDGTVNAILVSYACHPVVLGPDNLTWTGDYPHFVRKELETAHPGSVAIFATGCAGDVNTGHSSASSLTNKAKPDRSFSMAETIGAGLAQAALAAPRSEITGGVAAADIQSEITFEQREVGAPDMLARNWRKEAEGPNSIHTIWANWAEKIMGRNLEPRPARCSALNWCGVGIIALPGEIFAETALSLRQSVASELPLFVLSYCDDNPGYIPPRDAYARGGYEVEEAHRFYGMGASIAPGTSERLAKAGHTASQLASKKLTTTVTATKGS